MQKIKLSPAQQKNFSEALRSEASLLNQFKIAQAQVNSAANHRQGIFEMICESHGIDIKKLDAKSKINLSNDGWLSIGEASASERIKKALNKNIKSNGHVKAKTGSKKH